MTGNVTMAQRQLVRLQEAVSIEARVSAVNQAVWARNDRVVDQDERWYPVEVFDEYVIVRRGTGLLRVPYTMDDAGIVTEFGDPVAVEVQYTPVQMHEAHFADVRLLEGEGEEPGLVWEVEIIRPGRSANGPYYTPEVLRQAAPLYEGVHVFAFDDDARGHKPTAAEKTMRSLVGWIDTVGARGDGVLTGRLHFLREGLAARLRTQLLDAWQRGQKNLFGLSHDARGHVRSATVDGQVVPLVESIQRVLSVDIVLMPAAGGRFTRLVASATAVHTPEEGIAMNVRKRLLRLLEARRPDVFAGIDQETVTVDELLELVPQDALQEVFRDEDPAAGGPTPTSSPTPAPAPAPAPAASPAQADPNLVLQEARVLATQNIVMLRLAESKLPPLAQQRIRQRFKGQVATEEQVQEAIDQERTYLAALNPARVQGLGGPRQGAGLITVGPEKLDRLQAAFDLACGVEPEKPELRMGIKPIGLRGLYQELTLGHDPEVTGILSESAQRDMLQEAITNATLPRVVANTLHRRLLRDYRAVDYGERRIITVRPGVSDFKTQEAIRIGYFGDLSTVDPEAADYQEIAAYGEESATYAVGQRGNLLTITRKHIKNDDVGHIAKVVGRLGRAARRTFAQFVWNFWINNGDIYDGAAWFHASHNNLATSALSVAELNAHEILLFSQTELSSGKRLGLTPALLVVPIELKATAYTINQSQQITGSPNNDANPWYQRFGANNENILVNPLLTDANDWGLFASIDDADIIEVAFMDGQEEPEFFLADNPTVGQMFVADKIQYKIRHEYGGAVVEFRSATKAVVA